MAAAQKSVMLFSIACKAAIKAGTALGPEEMADLLRQMREAAVFSHCPHGRPLWIEISWEEIEKRFKRR